jgi:hypothetical protein
MVCGCRCLPKTMAPLKNLANFKFRLMFLGNGEIVILGEVPTLGLGFANIQWDMVQPTKVFEHSKSNSTLGTMNHCLH